MADALGHQGSTEGRTRRRGLPADFWVGVTLVASAVLFFLLAVSGFLGPTEAPEPPGKPAGIPPEPEPAPAPAPDAAPDLETELWAVPGVESLPLLWEDETPSPAAERPGGAGEVALAGLRVRVRQTHAPRDALALAEGLEREGTHLLDRAEEAGGEKELALRGRAADLFLEGLSQLTPVCAAFDVVRTQKGLDGFGEEKADLYRNARFLSASLHLLRAEAIEGPREEKDELLDKADLLFNDFIWDYEDYVQAYLAWVGKGREALQRGETEDAIRLYGVIFAIPDQSDFVPEQKPLRDRLRILAYFRSIQLFVRTGRPVEALEKALEMEREFPECTRSTFVDPETGRRAVLEKARALASLKRESEAARVAASVVSLGGSTMETGLALLAELGSADPGLGMRIRAVRAEGLLHSGKFREAADEFKEAIDAATSQEDRLAHGARLWFGLARAFLALGQTGNALDAFLEGDGEAQLHLGGNRWPEELFRTGARCSFSAFRILEEEVARFRRKGVAPPAGAERRFEVHRQRLVDLYSQSEWVMGLSYFTGRDRLSRGDFAGAVEAFRSTNTRSVYYEASLVGTGQAFFRDFLEALHEKKRRGPMEGLLPQKIPPAVLGALEKGESSLEFLLDRAEAAPAKGEALALRPRVLALARLYLAGIHSQREVWAEVIEVLEGFSLPPGAPREWALTGLFLKARALAELERPDAFEETLWALQRARNAPLSSGEGSRKRLFLEEAWGLAASLFETMAIKSADDADQAKAFTDLAAEYGEMKAQAAKETPEPEAPDQRRFWNSAIGIGGGAGGCFGGRFGGRRSLMLYGGGRETESAVLRGLVWLKKHQDVEGLWSCRTFTLHCENGVCGGPGSGEEFDIGVTALSLMAYLGAGHTHRHGKFKKVVKRGLRALIDRQTPDGCVGPHEGHGHWIYGHAAATQALSEAFGLSNSSPLLKDPAQRAVDFLVSCQNPYLGWRYGKQPGENDSCVTGWVVQALNSARIAGLKVPKESFLGALRWFDKAYDSETRRTGYLTRGDKAGLLPEAQGKFLSSEGLTAIGALCRILVLRRGPDRDEAVRGSGAVLVKNPPLWDVDAGTVDMHYWYWAAQAMFHLGGKPWKPWNRKLIEALVPNQRSGGCADGSWDPVGAWGSAGGRVYATALNVLTLEVYYRYGRILRGR